MRKGMIVVSLLIAACTSADTTHNTVEPRSPVEPHKSNERDPVWKWPTVSKPQAFDAFARVVAYRPRGTDSQLWVAQTSVRELRQPKTGATVKLVSTVHIAPAVYFRGLQLHLAAADAVIAEEPSIDAPTLHESLREVARFQRSVSTLLGFPTQWQWQARVSDERWISVDLPIEQASEILKQSPPEVRSEKTTKMIALIEKCASREGSPEETAFARRFAKILMQKNVLDYQRSPTLQHWHRSREDAVFSKLKELLGTRKHRHIAIVYGAAHTHALEPRIAADLGFRLFAVSWHDAIVDVQGAVPPQQN